jgi:uncharacterized Tic20 family protein
MLTLKHICSTDAHTVIAIITVCSLLLQATIAGHHAAITVCSLLLQATIAGHHALITVIAIVYNSTGQNYCPPLKCRHEVCSKSNEQTGSRQVR